MAQKRKIIWLSLAEAAKWIGPRRAGRPTSATTLWRWSTEGLRGVVLRSRLRGGVRMTRPSWVRAFFEEYAATRGQKQVEVMPTTPAKARRMHEKAMAELRAAGAL